MVLGSRVRSTSGSIVTMPSMPGLSVTNTPAGVAGWLGVYRRPSDIGAPADGEFAFFNGAGAGSYEQYSTGGRTTGWRPYNPFAEGEPWEDYYFIGAFSYADTDDVLKTAACHRRRSALDQRAGQIGCPTSRLPMWLRVTSIRLGGRSRSGSGCGCSRLAVNCGRRSANLRCGHCC